MKKTEISDRSKALIQLGFWFIFLLIVIAIANFKTADKPSPVETKKDLSENVQALLSANSYKYNYKYTDLANKTTYIYNGQVTDQTDSGYYESSSEVFKYSCELDKCFKIYTDHNDEFEFIKPALFDLSFFFSKTNLTSFTLKNEKDNEKMCYEDKATILDTEYLIDIYVFNDKIEKITIFSDKDSYELYLEY